MQFKATVCNKEVSNDLDIQSHAAARSLTPCMVGNNAINSSLTRYIGMKHPKRQLMTGENIK